MQEGRGKSGRRKKDAPPQGLTAWRSDFLGECDAGKFGKPKRAVKALFCPSCGGSDLYYEAGMIAGHVYHCKKCDYVGAFVIEREVETDELSRDRNKNRR